MALHACLNGRIVEKIVDINEEEYAEYIQTYSIVMNIEDLLIQPQIGWILNDSNILEPGPDQQVDLETSIESKIKYFQESAPKLLRDLYTTNTLLGITTQQSDQMFDDYQDVLIRIREGAWPTALYRLSQKEPSGFVTQEMIDNWYNLILLKIQE